MVLIAQNNFFKDHSWSINTIYHELQNTHKNNLDEIHTSCTHALKFSLSRRISCQILEIAEVEHETIAPRYQQLTFLSLYPWSSTARWQAACHLLQADVVITVHIKRIEHPCIMWGGKREWDWRPYIPLNRSYIMVWSIWHTLAFKLGLEGVDYRALFFNVHWTALLLFSNVGAWKICGRDGNTMEIQLIIVRHSFSYRSYAHGVIWVGRPRQEVKRWSLSGPSCALHVNRSAFSIAASSFYL